MKKSLFTVVAIVALSLAAKAQFSKGTIMAGGSVGYSSTTNIDEKHADKRFKLFEFCFFSSVVATVAVHPAAHPDLFEE